MWKTALRQRGVAMLEGGWLGEDSSGQPVGEQSEESVPLSNRRRRQKQSEVTEAQWRVPQLGEKRTKLHLLGMLD